MASGALFGLCTAFGEHSVWETRMSIFNSPNISCVRCMHRHPADITCEEAKKAAEAARDAYCREEEAQARADSLGITTEELATLPRREDAKFVPLPDGSGKLLSATVFSEMLFICCENGAYYRSKEGMWRNLAV